MQVHRVLHHIDHPLHLKYRSDPAVFGHVPQLCLHAAATLHLSCARAPAASRWVPSVTDFHDMLIKFVNGL